VLQVAPAQLEQLTEHGHPLGIGMPLLQSGPMAGHPMVVVVVDDVVDVVAVDDVVDDVVDVVVVDFEVGAHRRRREVMV
jgi:hypothetical protein